MAADSSSKSSPDSSPKSSGPGSLRRRSNAPRRSAARVAAVQALYQIDVTEGATAEGVLDEFVRYRLESGRRASDESVPGGTDRKLFLAIVRGVTARAGDIDDVLRGAMTEKWTVERLDPVLRSILRAGAFELVERADIPAKVSISEYVDVAHAFFEEREPGFVNGVLDRIARTLREGPPADGTDDADAAMTAPTGQ